MDSNYREYKHVDSFARIDEILKQPSTNFEERKSLPDRDQLSYSNGFYAYCSALFVAIRDSSTLPGIYNRPALAKLYRAFISEMVSIVNGSVKAREINIVGDCVWGVFNTPSKSDIDAVFSMVAQASSLMKVLNYKLLKKNYKTPVTVGIGMSYGRALMIKAGANGSGISVVSAPCIHPRPPWCRALAPPTRPDLLSLLAAIPRSPRSTRAATSVAGDLGRGSGRGAGRRSFLRGDR